MLTGNIIHLACLRALEHLRRGVELVRCRELCNITRVNQKCGLLFQGIDSVHGLLESLRHILIRLFVESYVAVADLDEAEHTLLLSARPETTGCKHSRVHSPDQPGAGPCHAFEKTATLDSVTLLLLVYFVRHRCASFREIYLTIIWP